MDQGNKGPVPHAAFPSFPLQDTVSALCPDDSQWYPGAIEKINDDGTFSVKWDDPDGGPETHDIEVAGVDPRGRPGTVSRRPWPFCRMGAVLFAARLEAGVMG